MNKTIRSLIKKAEATERLLFDPKNDIETLNAHKKGEIAPVSVYPSKIQIYRCYFFENDIMITYLTHLLRTEYSILEQILDNRFNYKPYIDCLILKDNKVVIEKSVNAGMLAHILFRFHHRIAKKYISEETFLF